MIRGLKMKNKHEVSVDEHILKLIPNYQKFIKNRDSNNYKDESTSALNETEVNVLPELNRMGLPCDPNGLVYLEDGVWVDPEGNLH